METLLKADIFFFISSIGVILVTIALLVVAFYAVRTIQEIRELLASVRQEIDALRLQRKRAVHRARFFGKWVLHFAGNMLRNVRL